MRSDIPRLSLSIGSDNVFQPALATLIGLPANNREMDLAKNFRSVPSPV